MNAFRRQAVLALSLAAMGISLTICPAVLHATPISPNDPSIVGSLQVWYSAGAGVTTQDNSGSGGSTTAVNAWADQSGNGNNATQATAGLMPTLVSNWSNGQSAIQFTRTSATAGGNSLTDNGSLAGGAGINVSTSTIFLVGSFNSGGDTSCMLGLCDVATPSSASNLFFQDTTTSSGTLFVRTATSGGSNRLDNTAVTGVDFNPHIFTLAIQRANPGEQEKIYVDGVDQGGTIATTGTPTNAINAVKYLSLGNRAGSTGATSFLSGFLGEVIIYNTLLTSTQISGVDEYLNDKYFVAAPEPSGMVLAMIGGGIAICVAARRSQRFVRNAAACK